MSDAILRFVGLDSGLGAQFRKIDENLKKLETGATKTSNLLARGFATAGGVIAGISFLRLAQETFQYAEQLQIASARTGIQIEQLQRLQFIAGQSETSFEAITASINKFQINVASGSEKTTEALNRLNISLGEIAGLEPDAQFLRIAESISKVGDPATRAKLAVDLFSKSGTQLLPLLRQGAHGIEELSRQFNEMGGALSAETIGKVDELGDSFARLATQSKNLLSELVALSEPVVSPLLEGITDLLADARILLGEADELAVLAENIKFLKEQRGGLGVVAIGESKFNPEGGLGFLNNKEIERTIKNLERQRDIILELRKPPPLEDIKFNPNDFQITQLISGDPSARQLREDFLDDSRENPNVVKATEEKDLLIQLNQEKVDEIIRQEGEMQAERLRLATENNDTILGLTEAFVGQTIDLERFKADSVANSNLALASLAGEVAANVFEENKAFQIATAIISTYTGVTNALKDFPYPYNIAVGALVAAQGFANVQKIRSTRKGGGGGYHSRGSGGLSVGGSAAGRSSGSVSATGTAPTQPGATQKPQSTINVYGWSEGAIRELVKRIREESSDHDLHVIRN